MVVLDSSGPSLGEEERLPGKDGDITAHVQQWASKAHNHLIAVITHSNSLFQALECAQVAIHSAAERLAAERASMKEERNFLLGAPAFDTAPLVAPVPKPEPPCMKEPPPFQFAPGNFEPMHDTRRPKEVGPYKDFVDTEASMGTPVRTKCQAEMPAQAVQAAFEETIWQSLDDVPEDNVSMEDMCESWTAIEAPSVITKVRSRPAWTPPCRVDCHGGGLQWGEAMSGLALPPGTATCTSCGPRRPWDCDELSRLGSVLFTIPWPHHNGQRCRRAVARPGPRHLLLLGCEKGVLPWSVSEVAELPTLVVASWPCEPVPRGPGEPKALSSPVLVFGGAVSDEAPDLQFLEDLKEEWEEEYVEEEDEEEYVEEEDEEEYEDDDPWHEQRVIEEEEDFELDDEENELDQELQDEQRMDDELQQELEMEQEEEEELDEFDMDMTEDEEEAEEEDDMMLDAEAEEEEIEEQLELEKEPEPEEEEPDTEAEPEVPLPLPFHQQQAPQPLLGYHERERPRRLVARARTPRRTASSQRGVDAPPLRLDAGPLPPQTAAGPSQPALGPQSVSRPPLPHLAQGQLLQAVPGPAPLRPAPAPLRSGGGTASSRTGGAAAKVMSGDARWQAIAGALAEKGGWRERLQSAGLGAQDGALPVEAGNSQRHRHPPMGPHGGVTPAATAAAAAAGAGGQPSGVEPTATLREQLRCSLAMENDNRVKTQDARPGPGGGLQGGLAGRSSQTSSWRQRDNFSSRLRRAQ